MFKIEEDIISLTRGDKCVIGFSINEYTFKVGDYVNFRVYKKNGLDSAPLLEKRVEVNEEAESIDIELTSTETKIGELGNKVVEYWYEIELNGNQTVIGYDEKGAKKLMLYPEGADNNA